MKRQFWSWRTTLGSLCLGHTFEGSVYDHDWGKDVEWYPLRDISLKITEGDRGQGTVAVKSLECITDWKDSGWICEWDVIFLGISEVFY